MPTRSHLRRSNRSTPNRSWSAFNTAAPVAVPAASKVLLGSFSLTNPGIDETVLRTVGAFAVQSDQLGATEDQLGAFGMYVVTDRAIAIGLSAIPGPVTNAATDGWFMWKPILQEFAFGTGVGFIADMATRYDFDSKAKRIVNNGFGIAIMVENIHATHAFEITTSFRLLSMVRGTG